MTNNCPRYNQLLQDWREAISRLREVCEEFQDTGNLSLREKFERNKSEVRKKKSDCQRLLYEKILLEFEEREKERIIVELENVPLGKNTPWKIIEILSLISGGGFDLTNIQPEHKSRIVRWKGSIKDCSTDRVDYRNLQTVDGFLSIYNARAFFVDSLRAVGGVLYIPNTKTFSARCLTNVKEIRLKRANFADENDQIDFEKLEREKRLVLPEEMRDRIVWVD